MTYGATWPEVAAVGQEIDRLGYDFLLMHDHLLATQGDLYQPFFESYTTLGAWAVLTKQVHLGHLTVGNPFRNPGVVAKATTTLDHITNGRMTLVLGAGILPEEFPLHGLAVGQIARRPAARARRIALHRDAAPGRRGGQLRLAELPLRDASSTGRGRSSAHVPVIVGATGEKIGLRIAAKYADYWQMSVDPSTLDEYRHKAEVLDAPRARRRPRPGARSAGCPEGSFIIRETREEARDAFTAYAAPLQVVRRESRASMEAAVVGRVVRGDRREPEAVPRRPASTA